MSFFNSLKCYFIVGEYLFDLQQGSNYGNKITTKAADFMKKTILILKILQKEILKE